jgi:protein subunit release factor A
MHDNANNSNAPLIRKLDEMSKHYTDLQNMLGDPAVLSNPQRMVSITKESGQLQPVVGGGLGVLGPVQKKKHKKKKTNHTQHYYLYDYCYINYLY